MKSKQNQKRTFLKISEQQKLHYDYLNVTINGYRDKIRKLEKNTFDLIEAVEDFRSLNIDSKLHTFGLELDTFTIKTFGKEDSRIKLVVEAKTIEGDDTFSKKLTSKYEPGITLRNQEISLICEIEDFLSNDEHSSYFDIKVLGTIFVPNPIYNIPSDKRLVIEFVFNDEEKED